MAGRLLVKDGRIVVYRTHDTVTPVVVAEDVDCDRHACSDCCDLCGEEGDGGTPAWPRGYNLPIEDDATIPATLVGTFDGAIYNETAFGEVIEDIDIAVALDGEVSTSDASLEPCFMYGGYAGAAWTGTADFDITGTYAGESISVSFTSSDIYRVYRAVTISPGFILNHTRIEWQKTSPFGSPDDAAAIEIRLYQLAGGLTCGYVTTSVSIHYETGSETVYFANIGVALSPSYNAMATDIQPALGEWTIDGFLIVGEKTADYTFTHTFTPSLIECLWLPETPTIAVDESCDPFTCRNMLGQIVDARCCRGELSPDDPLCGPIEPPADCCMTPGEWYFDDDTNMAFTAEWDFGRYGLDDLIDRRFRGNIPNVLKAAPPTQTDCGQVRTALTRSETTGNPDVYAMQINYTTTPPTGQNNDWLFTNCDVGYASVLPSGPRFTFTVRQPGSTNTLFAVNVDIDSGTATLTISSTATGGIAASHFTNSGVVALTLPLGTAPNDETFYYGGSVEFLASNTANRTLGYIRIGIAATRYGNCNDAMMGLLAIAGVAECGGCKSKNRKTFALSEQDVLDDTD